MIAENPKALIEDASPQKRWIAALAGQVELLPSAELALNMILIADGIDASSRLEREVTPDDLLA